MYVLIFSASLPETFLILRRAEKCFHKSTASARYPCLTLLKVEFSQQIFEKYSNVNFHPIRPIGAELFHADDWTKGQTDRQTEKDR